jgi:hypothetical protein
MNLLHQEWYGCLYVLRFKKLSFLLSRQNNIYRLEKVCYFCFETSKDSLKALVINFVCNILTHSFKLLA